MADLSDVPLDELEQELTRRRGSEPCPCGKWTTYMGVWDADGYTRRCYGCLKATGKCTCGSW